MNINSKKVLAVVAIPFFIAASGILMTGCSNEVKAESPKETPMMATNVVGYKTEIREFSDSIFVVGTLDSNESVDIISEISGVIVSVGFKEGQRVEEGDVLFQIDANKLKAMNNQAVANLKLAETTAKRYENLVQSKAVSQQEYDETIASLESNRASVELTKEQLDDATITAPFSGIMGERFVSKGQFISQGTQLSYLFNQNPIKAEFHVPERYLSEIEVGQTVTMKVAAYEDEEYTGEVYFIDPKINEITRTALVKAYVANPMNKLREGMFANIKLMTSVSKNALTVPETALIIKGDKVFVYVVNDDQTVELKPVETGKRFDGMVVIKTGLNNEDIVVVEGYQKIGPGSKVSVRFADPDEKKIYEII